MFDTEESESIWRFAMISGIGTGDYGARTKADERNDETQPK